MELSWYNSPIIDWAYWIIVLILFIVTIFISLVISKLLSALINRSDNKKLAFLNIKSFLFRYIIINVIVIVAFAFFTVINLEKYTYSHLSVEKASLIDHFYSSEYGEIDFFCYLKNSEKVIFPTNKYTYSIGFNISKSNSQYEKSEEIVLDGKLYLNPEDIDFIVDDDKITVIINKNDQIIREIKLYYEDLED